VFTILKSDILQKKIFSQLLALIIKILYYVYQVLCLILKKMYLMRFKIKKDTRYTEYIKCLLDTFEKHPKIQDRNEFKMHI